MQALVAPWLFGPASLWGVAGGTPFDIVRTAPITPDVLTMAMHRAKLTCLTARG